jgi:hypothetical protein
METGARYRDDILAADEAGSAQVGDGGSIMGTLI